MDARIAQMAAWSRNHDVRPVPVPVTYDDADLLYPEPITIARRLRAYLLQQDVIVGERQRFTGAVRFDGSVPADIFHRTGHKHFQALSKAFYNKPVDNLSTFEWQHATADFGRVIREGMAGFLARIEASREAHRGEQAALDFLEALAITCNAIVAWGEKCADACARLAAAEQDAQRRAELQAMAECCRRVPARPAQTFREGVQAVYTCFAFLPDSIGTIDRYLYPLYAQDIAAGTLTRAQAKAYLQELFLLVDGHTPFNNGNNRGNYSAECHFAIGGYNEDWEDGFTDLSRLVLEALMELPTYRPQISFRWTNKTPFETLRYVLDCERKDAGKRIAFISDDARLPSLIENAGLSETDALNYSTCGCNEPALQGGIWFGGMDNNIVRCLTNTLFQRTAEACACAAFEDFYALFSEELAKDMAEILDMGDRFNVGRSKDVNVLSSLFLHGCIENAASVTQGGCSLAITGPELQGLVCLIDSLSVIEQFVYEEGAFSMERLIHALQKDWEGEELLRTWIVKKARFFGNDDPSSNAMARRVIQSMRALVQGRKGLYGAPILFGTQAGYNPHYIWFGNLTEATPDGRHKGDPFMVGMGQTAGKDREGLTALLNAVAQADPTGILAGPYVCNVNVDPVLVEDDEQFEKTARLVEAYFRQGGLQIQINYVLPEELRKAQANPDAYQGLRVRVSGFSANFTVLSQDIQEDIIRRTLVR